jgi:hypothetical protein
VSEQIEIAKRRPKVIVRYGFTIDKVEHNETENHELPEALMAFAEQVRGNAGARVSYSTDFSMKEFGNGPNGSVTISLDCNQDDQTITSVAQGLSQWTIALAETHYTAAEAKFRQMVLERQGGGGPPSFKP